MEADLLVTKDSPRVWWSVGLAAVFVVLLIFGVVLEVLVVSVAEGMVKLYGITILLCALVGVVVGLIALLRGHERSAHVWLAMVPGLATLAFLIGEFLGKW